MATLIQSIQCSELIIPQYNCKTANSSLPRAFVYTTGRQQSLLSQEETLPTNLQILKTTWDQNKNSYEQLQTGKIKHNTSLYSNLFGSQTRKLPFPKIHIRQQLLLLFPDVLRAAFTLRSFNKGSSSPQLKNEGSPEVTLNLGFLLLFFVLILQPTDKLIIIHSQKKRTLFANKGKRI